MTQLYGKIFLMQARLELTIPYHPCFSLGSSHVGVQTNHTIPVLSMRTPVSHSATAQIHDIVLICTGRPEAATRLPSQDISEEKVAAAYLQHFQ